MKSRGNQEVTTEGGGGGLSSICLRLCDKIRAAYAGF